MNIAADHVSISYVKDVLDYEVETGLFRWRRQVGNSNYPGKIAGWKDSKGYLKVQLSGKGIFLHRLAWLLVHGEWPSKIIDHIDRNRTNNAIANLRLVSQRENCHNKGHEVLGYQKVSSNRWRASAWLNGKHTRLGMFNDEASAHAAYKAAIAKADAHE